MRKSLLLVLAPLVVAGAPAHAAQGDLLVRLRAIMVAPNERTGPVTPSFATADTSVNTSYAPELDFTYMVTNHVGTELILATTKHHVTGRGPLAGVGRLANTWVLPPTLTLQYHFLPAGRVHPYGGVGLNYTLFYNEKATAALNAAIGQTSVKLKDSAGYALQAGLDVDVAPRVFVNFDIKYIDIDTTAKLTTGTLVNRERVHLDPIVAGVGIGMRF